MRLEMLDGGVVADRGGADEQEGRLVLEAVAAAELQMARQPKMQNIIPVPSKQTQELHALTHVPYQPWCEVCLKYRGGPDRHLSTGACHVPEDGEEVIDLYDQEEREDGREPRIKELKSAMWLIMVCSQTGSLGAVPLQSKAHGPRDHELCPEFGPC